MTLEQREPTPTPSTPRDAARPPTPDCIIRGCPNLEKTRGLCGTCYAGASKAVKAGKVTWDWLVSQGLAKPTRKKHTKPVGLFAAQLHGAMAANPPQASRQSPGISAPEAAHAASDGPAAPMALTSPPLEPPAKLLIPVDPNTGQPYVHPPVVQPQQPELAPARAPLPWEQ